MKINQISQAYGIEIQKAAGNKKEVTNSEKPARGDTVEVSKKARELGKTSAEATATAQRAASLPESRHEKVEDVKRKIADGYYNTPEFSDKLADRLIKDFGL